MRTDSPAGSSRPPYPVLAAATLVAVFLVAAMVPGLVAPVQPGCFEWCNLDEILATAGISTVGLAWLLLVLVIAWRWRNRTPAIAGLCAILAAALLLVVTGMAMAVGTSRSGPYALFQLGYVMSLGLELPPAWRLAQGSRPMRAGKAGAVIMTIAAALAAVAFVALGTDIYSSGPQVLSLASVASTIGLALLAPAAWRGGGSGTVGPALLTAASILMLFIIALSLFSDGTVQAISMAAFVLLAVAWLSLGTRWVGGFETGRHLD